jgi:hypothetical protein
MNEFEKLRQADRRLAILQLLMAEGWSMNEYLLRRALELGHGHKISRDLLLSDLAWLKEQGLVNTNVVQELHMAMLTARGKDVANGAVVVPGVQRPEPEA